MVSKNGWCFKLLPVEPPLKLTVLDQLGSHLNVLRCKLFNLNCNLVVHNLKQFFKFTYFLAKFVQVLTTVRILPFFVLSQRILSERNLSLKTYTDVSEVQPFEISCLYSLVVLLFNAALNLLRIVEEFLRLGKLLKLLLDVVLGQVQFLAILQANEFLFCGRSVRDQSKLELFRCVTIAQLDLPLCVSQLNFVRLSSEGEVVYSCYYVFATIHNSYISSFQPVSEITTFDPLCDFPATDYDFFEFL